MLNNHILKHGPKVTEVMNGKEKTVEENGGGGTPLGTDFPERSVVDMFSTSLMEHQSVPRLLQENKKLRAELLELESEMVSAAGDLES